MIDADILATLEESSTAFANDVLNMVEFHPVLSQVEDPIKSAGFINAGAGLALIGGQLTREQFLGFCAHAWDNLLPTVGFLTDKDIN